MTAYIAISYEGRQRLSAELKTICAVLKNGGIDPFVFVDHYTFHATDEKAMMAQAMKEIDRCDLLLAAASEKAIGIGIEAGYAKGKGKTVIYIRHAAAPHSTTLSGLSDHQVIFLNLPDLSNKLTGILKN
jgi:nucleoside 2-deoxyribosyltransferase